MRWRPARPWFGPSPYGKIRPTAPAGYIALFGAIALVVGLLFLGRALPPLLIIALATALLVALLTTLVATYGPADPPRP
jgi:hypothetical protein